MDTGYLVAGIDHDGFSGLLIAKDGAVALEGAYGKGLENHRKIQPEPFLLAGLRGRLLGGLIAEYGAGVISAGVENGEGE